MKLFYVKILCERQPRKHRQEIKTLKIYAEDEKAAVNMAVGFVCNILDQVPEGFKVREASPGIVEWDATSKSLREIADEEAHSPYTPISERVAA